MNTTTVTPDDNAPAHDGEFTRGAAPKGDETMTTTYAITWAHGQTDTGFETYEAAEAAVRSVLSGAEIGHSGDIADGGERTLFWASAEAAQDDDGARAAGSIRKRHAE